MRVLAACPPGSESFVVRHMGLVPYEQATDAMSAFNADRTADTPDEIWVLQHPPVYTLGMGGRTVHLHDPGEIPVVRTDRGGQVTYHGPGQLVLYCLIHLARGGMGPRALISALEDATITALRHWDIQAQSRKDAPGVYVGTQKLASVGLRIERGFTSHGLAINICNDLSPFRRIDPCGIPGLAMTRTTDLNGPSQVEDLCPVLLQELHRHLASRPAVARRPNQGLST